MKGSKKKQSLFNRIIAWLHLWPSIVAGIIVVFISITGTIIVYSDEIIDFSAGDAKYVEIPLNNKHISQDQIFKAVEEINPKYEISEFIFFKDPKRSIRLRCFDLEHKKLIMLYVNPYTGKVLMEDDTIHFFFITAHLHSALLAGKIGGWIVILSTIIFTISCLTGLILWWPKRWTKTTRQASFTVKWRARFKRLNYDLHNVYGFYSLILCLILGVTGLIIFFRPLMNTTIKVSGGSPIHLEDVLPKIDSTTVTKDFVYLAYSSLEAKQKNEISMWNQEDPTIGAYSFSFGNTGLRSVENKEMLILDRISGKEISIGKQYIKHETTENTVWQLHMGQWWGQIGKLSTFLAGIVATTLPITGFIIWWGKQKKKKKRKIFKN
ncbi:PepSY-associated TM helix domain-containing protein [Empedobacter brevis]|uniref:PepSY-associated TM helix domain-containing protein n=1 Tax=Empedobacter brevis TaxID=247 RepID=UPI0039AEBC43